jgi:hypothetical protein
MMIKKTIFVFLLLISQFCVKAQNWLSVGSPIDWQVRYLYNDTLTNKLIASSAVGSYARFLQYSDTTDWDTLGNLIGAVPFQIVNYQGNYYGVNYHSNAMYSGVATLVNHTWQPYASTFGPAYGLVKKDSSLYVLGDFDSIAGIKASSFARYDGTNWHSYNVGFGGGSGTNCVIEYQGNLFVGGGFHDTIGNCLAYFDGQNWHGFGNFFSGGFDAVNAMAVFNGELYVGGYFIGSPGNFIARWNGSTWTQVGGGIWGGQVLAMKVFNNSLWVGGQFTTAGGIATPYLAKYDGTDWCNVGNFDNATTSLEIYNNELYVGGGFWSIDGDSITYIAKWIGGNNTNQCGHLNTGIEAIQQPKIFSVFPNPASESVTFQTEGSVSGFELVITDQLGREIYRQQCATNSQEVNVESYAPGLYFYSINTAGSKTESGKLVIE